MNDTEKLATALADQLGWLGFVPIPPRREGAGVVEAGVTSERYGITVQVDPDAGRIIIAARGTWPAHRLLVPRHTGLSQLQTVQIAARLAREEIARREE